MNILLTSGGRRVALLRAFRRALTALGLDGRIIVADASPVSSAFHDADVAELVPRAAAPEYLDALLDVCVRHRIALVVPLIDPELPVLAAARERFAAIGATVVASGPQTAAVSDSKQGAAAFFARHGIGTGRVIETEAALAGRCGFPVFLRPDNGSSSIGSRAIHSADELAYWLPRTRRPVLTEYLVGTEYTIDVYCGLDGQPRCAVPRRRLETRGGEVSKGITERVPAVIEGALAAARALPDARGVLTFQCMVGPDAIPRFFELNARFGGGAPLSIAAGADFPRWLIEERLGREPSIASPPFRDGVLMLRWDDAVFVEGGHRVLGEVAP